MKIITGAGGHALELFDILVKSTTNNIFFYDDINTNINSVRECHVFHDITSIPSTSEQIYFYLGVGNPMVRKALYQKFKSINGVFSCVRGLASFSKYSTFDQVDVFDHCFIGPDVSISKGTLINTGAQVHHHATIGEFCEISPGAKILGKAEIGNHTSIGANSTILPGIKIGSNVIIGAGSVVTRNIADGTKAYGVPAQSVK